MVHLVHEIFAEFRKAPTRETKIMVLRKYGSFQFKELLNYAYNPGIVIDISQIPTYKKSVQPAGLNDMYLLYQGMKKLYLFIPKHARYVAKLPVNKEQAILSTILSSLHTEEAKILEDVLMKRLKVDGLTPKLILEAFPDMPFPKSAVEEPKKEEAKVEEAKTEEKKDLKKKREPKK